MGKETLLEKYRLERIVWLGGTDAGSFVHTMPEVQVLYEYAGESFQLTAGEKLFKYTACYIREF